MHGSGRPPRRNRGASDRDRTRPPDCRTSRSVFIRIRRVVFLPGYGATRRDRTGDLLVTNPFLALSVDVARGCLCWLSVLRINALRRSSLLQRLAEFGRILSSRRTFGTHDAAPIMGEGERVYSRQTGTGRVLSAIPKASMSIRMSPPLLLTGHCNVSQRGLREGFLITGGACLNRMNSMPGEDRRGCQTMRTYSRRQSYRKYQDAREALAEPRQSSVWATTPLV
jgi:hypothetical protein